MEWNKIIVLMFLFSGLGSAWLTPYTNRYLINCTSSIGVPIVINGSGGFVLGTDTTRQIVWANCSNETMYLYFYNSTSYAVANNLDVAAPFDVEWGNVSDYLGSLVWGIEKAVYHMTGMLDSTSNGYNLTATGAVQTTNGKIFNGSYYDGTNDYQDVASWDTPPTTGAFSYTAWVNSTDTNGDNNVWSFGKNTVGHIQFRVNSADDDVEYYHYYSSAWHDCTSTDLWASEYGEKHMLTVTYDGTNARIWKDGVLATTCALSQTAGGTHTTHHRFGVDGPSNGDYSGMLDEIRMTLTNLSADYILDMFNNSEGHAGFGNLGVSAAGLFSSITETYNTSGLEGTTHTFGLVINSTAGAVTGNFSFNGTSYAVTPTSNGTVYTFSKEITLPAVSASASVPFFWTFAINGTGYNTTNRSFTILNTILYNCSSNDANVMLRYFLVNETTPTSAVYNATVFINLNVSSGGVSTPVQLNYNGTAQHNISICSNQSNINYVGDVDFIGSTYVQRTYHIYNGYYNGTATNQTLYFLASALATLVKFRVVSDAQSPLSGAYLYLLKEFPTNETSIGLYFAVSSARMDDKGEGYMYLQLDKFYKFNVVSEGLLKNLKSSDRILIQTNLDTIQVETTGAGLGDYWTTALATSVNCRTNQTANNTICSWISGGEFTEACINVYWINGSEKNLLEDWCETDTQGTESISYNNTYTTWFYEFSIWAGDTLVLIKTGYFYNLETPQYDYTLAILVVMVILTLGVVLGVPEYTALLSGVALAGSTLIGILPLGNDIGILGLFLGIISAYLIHEGGKNAT